MRYARAFFMIRELFNLMESDPELLEAKKILEEFENVKNRLKDLGILRGELALGGYFEWFCAKIFQLALADSQVQSGYDAVTKTGERVQIKSRKERASGNSFDFRPDRPLQGFDYLYAVFYSNKYNVTRVYKIPHSYVKSRLQAGNRFRWNRQVEDECSMLQIYPHAFLEDEKVKCPLCGSVRIARVLYGLPDESVELMEIDEGRIRLGGCVVTGDDPRWKCNDCNTRIK